MSEPITLDILWSTLPGPVIDWEEIHEGRMGEIDQVGAIRTYTRVFRIITASPLVGPQAILTNAEFLGLLALYIESDALADVGAILRNVRVEQPERDNPCVWLVTYEYSSEPLDAQQRGVVDTTQGVPDNSPQGQGVQEPLVRPPIWSLSPSKYQRVMVADVYGNPCCNSTGALFSPLPEVDDTRWILTCERNELEPNFGLILSYQDAINSDVFAGLLPGTAKISISAQQMFENGQYFWRVTYQFEIRSYVNILGILYSGWDRHELDRGFYYLDKFLVPRKILDSSGIPVSDPVLLDGQGGQLGTNKNPTGVARSTVKSGVLSITVTNPGSGYVNNAASGLAVQITGGGGSGATAVAVAGNGSLNPTQPGAGAPISAIFMRSQGSGYTSAPTVSIVGGGGSGATAVANIGFLPVWLHYRPHPWLPFSVFNLPTKII